MKKYQFLRHSQNNFGKVRTDRHINRYDEEFKTFVESDKKNGQFVYCLFVFLLIF